MKYFYVGATPEVDREALMAIADRAGAEFGAPVDKMGDVDVNSTKFFSAFEKLFKDTPLESWKSYLRWRVVNRRAGELSAAFVNEDFDFFGRRLYGQKELKPRWKRCVSRADSELSEILGRKYVEQEFDVRDKETALKMIGQVESAMQSDIEKIDWMSPETKKKALDKLANVTNKIGYPDKWWDYSTLNIERGDLAGNASRAAEFKR